MNEEIGIRIVSVAENHEATVMHRWEMMRHNGSPVNIELSAKFKMQSHDRLALRLEVLYTATRSLIVRHLLKYVADVVFDIDHLGEIVSDDDGSILLPRELLVTAMSVGIGALRGMLALRTADTFLAHYPLPLFDLRQLVSNMAEAPAAARGELPSITISN